MNYEDRDPYGMYKGTGIGTGNDNGNGNSAGTGNGNGLGYSDMPEHHGPGPALMGADTLIGNDVYNTQDKDLGDIKEIMIDMRSGRISYAVLSFGGFLGMGTKLFAVPWEALKLDTFNKRFVLDVSADRLESAPGFDSDAWPNMADRSWSDGIHAYYGTKPHSDGLRL